MAKRFKAQLVVASGIPHGTEMKDVEGLHATRERALKAGIDAALAEGLIVVTETEAVQEVTRKWVEKK